MASQAIYLVDFLMGGRNFISRVYSLASPVYRLFRESSGESGYMPRNFSELKSGVEAIPMLSPHAEKWGDASPPSPTDRRPCLVCLRVMMTLDTYAGRII